MALYSIYYGIRATSATLVLVLSIIQLGGYLYITEHMIVNYLEKVLTDIEHTIYEISHA